MKTKYSVLRIISLMSLLMLVLLLAITSTFSWYPRTSSTTGKTKYLEYEFSGSVTPNSEKTISTYVGTNVLGEITYASEALADDRTIPVNSEKVYYFKTAINDTTNGGDSVISLYLDKITASGTSIQVGLSSPEKSFKTASLINGSVSNYCLEDNIFITSNGTVEVYWFIKYTGSSPLVLGNFFYTIN